MTQILIFSIYIVQEFNIRWSFGSTLVVHHVPVYSDIFKELRNWGRTHHIKNYFESIARECIIMFETIEAVLKTSGDEGHGFTRNFGKFLTLEAILEGINSRFGQVDYVLKHNPKDKRSTAFGSSRLEEEETGFFNFTIELSVN